MAFHSTCQQMLAAFSWTLILFGMMNMHNHLIGQQPNEIRPTNYDESAVPTYTLPDLLTAPDGRRVATPESWEAQRSYWLDLLARQEYGTFPAATVAVRHEEFERGLAFDGKVLRRQIAVYLSRVGANENEVRVDLLVYSPVDLSRKASCFLGLNFRGNQGTADDPEIRLTESWVQNDEGFVNNRATEAARASKKYRYPIERIIERGYAVATAYYGDLDPDFDDGFENGVHALFPEHRSSDDQPECWGSIGAWAWGLSRLAVVLEQLEGIDPEGLIVVGHSRLGKTALWAGANDPRFRIVLSNNSGCGGAALSKRAFGETVARINSVFPHWFCKNFRAYNDREENMPFDQHCLIAAIAPRPVYIASASKDLWADPKGEYLSGWHASRVYELFGLKGLPSEELPKAGVSVGDYVGYHLKDGEHALEPYDWEHYMNFADRHLR